MAAVSWNIIFLIYLSAIANASPARLLRNHEVDGDAKVDFGRDWERQLEELRSFRPEIYREDRWKFVPDDGNSPPQINYTGFVAGDDEGIHAGTSYEDVPYVERNLYQSEVPDFYYESQPEMGLIEEDYDYVSRPHDSLAESLAYFLGSPEENWEMGDHGDEIDFGNVWELDAVRQMGKEANVPQYLVDSVDPEADENLLELMVRIAENPEKWRSIHAAIQRLDEALSNREKASYERKDIEKRSSRYTDDHEYHLKTRNKKKKKKHFDSLEDSSWERARRPQEKIRHGTYPIEYEKPKSAAYASVVFNNNENKNFERWKVNYQPVRPEDFEGGVPKDYKHPQLPTRTITDYDRYAKKKLKMKSMAKAREKEDKGDSWKTTKYNKHLVDKWSKVKQFRNGETEKEKDKENWVDSKEHKENWPRFAYHRVTSSPGVQQRDAGAQPRHRSAYVAVSVVPTNSTVSGVFTAKNEKFHEDVRHPPFFDSSAYEGKTKSLRGVEEKFHMGESERLRLFEVMRDASVAPNTTT